MRHDDFDEDSLSEALREAVSHIPGESAQVSARIAAKARNRAQRRMAISGIGACLVAVAITAGVAHHFGGNSSQTFPENLAVGGESMRHPADASMECPGVETDWTWSPAHAGIADVMVPPGTTSALICRYTGVRDSSLTPLSLTNAGVLSTVDTERFAVALNSSKAQLVHHCHPRLGPDDAVYVKFYYGANSPVDVRMSTDICKPATNGILNVEAPHLDLSPYWSW